MKNAIYIVSLLFMTITLNSQDQINISFENGDRINLIAAVSDIEQKMKDSTALLGVFHDYFHTTTYSAFKALFPPNANIFDENTFYEWRNAFDPSTIEIEGIYEYELKATRYADVLYKCELDGFYDRNSISLIKIGPTWYPTDYNQNARLNEIAVFLRKVKPQFLKSVGQTSPTKTFSSKLLLNQADSSSRSSENPLFNLNERINADQIYKEDRLNDGKFISYMDTLNLDESIKAEALEHIKSLQYVKAANVIARALGRPEILMSFNRKIAEIYGDDRIFTSTNKKITIEK